MKKLDGVNETIDLEVLEAEAIPLGLEEHGVRIAGDGPDETAVELYVTEDGELEIRAFAITSRPTEDIEIVSTITVLNLADPHSVIAALSNTI